MTPRVEFASVSKSFGGVNALSGVSFSVAPGTVHALVGENGAGKSTLMKLLAGALRPDAGTITLDAAPHAPGNPRDAARAGIAIVHQELSLAPHLSIAENVCLGRWPRSSPWIAGGLVQRHQMRRAARDALSALGAEFPAGVDTPAGALAVAQQQMVELARALSMNCRVLVLDEPSAVLTPAEVERLFTTVRRLVAAGVSVLYISHRLEDVLTLASTVTVLRDGRHVSTRPVAQTSRASLIREMVGRECAPAVTSPPSAASPEGTRPVVLRTRSLCSGGRFHDVTLDVRASEIFGLAGLVGSGRTSLGMALMGAAPVSAGDVEVTSIRGPFRSIRHAISAGVALAPEDRKKLGLLTSRTVRENLTLGDERRHARAGVVSADSEHAFARNLVERFTVRCPNTESPVWTLSGGNQQKVLLARWLARGAKLVILDEPTRGVDVGAKAEIHALIRRAADAGAAVLMISSDLPELIAHCDRIGVMARGRLAGILDNPARDVTQERLMSLAFSAD